MASPRSSAGVTRARLISAAHLRFTTHGYAGTSIAALASELGMSKASVMHHFPRKSALYLQVIQDVGGRMATAVGGARDARALIDGIVAWTIAHPTDVRLVLREMVDMFARDPLPDVWPLADSVQIVEAHLRSGQADGLVRRISSVEMQVCLLLGTVSDEIMAGARDAAQAYLEDNASKDPGYRKVYEAFSAARTEQRTWFGTAERAYHQFVTS